MNKIILAVLAVCAAMSESLFAQSTGGSLEGWVLDTNRTAIPAANVTAASSALQGTRTVATDERGFFELLGLPAGVYTVSITHVSHTTVAVRNVRVSLGGTTTLGRILLGQRVIESQEVVTVGASPLIDPGTAGNGVSLSRDQFVALPLQRDYIHLSELLPDANLSYKQDGTNFAGGTGAENKYFIDGAEVTDPVLGNTGISLPYNFVREIQVRSGGYEAEYQSSLGGTVNAITGAGGNEFHAQVFGFVTNNSFNAAPRLASGTAPGGSFADYDGGFTAGGPVVADRLWYFVAYDPHVLTEDVPVNGLGMRGSHSTTHMFAGKLSWNPDPANLLSVALAGDPVTGKGVSTSANGKGLTVLNPEACEFDYTNSDISVIVNGSHALTGNLTLETSVSYIGRVRRVQPTGGAADGLLINDLVTSTASGGSGISQDDVTGQFVGSVKAAWRLSSHLFKAGLGYAENSLSVNESTHAIEHDPGFYYLWDALVTGTIRQRSPSAFLQDSWQISDRWCLNAGVRWDPQWLITSEGVVGQKITDQVQPRIGVIFQPAEPGSQKITASFGRFYQPVQLALSSSYHIRNSAYMLYVYPNDPRVDRSNPYFAANLDSYVANVPGVGGQYFDEFALGYERTVPGSMRAGVRGIYRTLRQGIEDGVVSDQDQVVYNSLQVYGNPGKGPLSLFPGVRREFLALEFTLERRVTDGLNFFASYTLSRNSGNYDGLAETNDVTTSFIAPNVTDQFGAVDRMRNAQGLLPNDRTHVLKFSGSYAFSFGLTTGMVFQWMSGTPLNEFGVDSLYGASTFLQPRGSAGRGPSIWDLSLRFMYDLPGLSSSGFSARLILDVLHVASQRTAINYDQYHYLDAFGTVNPHYLVPIQFLPPMSARLGMEVNF